MTESQKPNLTEIVSKTERNFANRLAESADSFYRGLMIVPTMYNAIAYWPEAVNRSFNIRKDKLAETGLMVGLLATSAEFLYLSYQAIAKNDYVPIVAVGAIQAGALAYKLLDDAKKKQTQTSDSKPIA